MASFWVKFEGGLTSYINVSSLITPLFAEFLLWIPQKMRTLMHLKRQVVRQKVDENITLRWANAYIRIKILFIRYLEVERIR